MKIDYLNLSKIIKKKSVIIIMGIFVLVVVLINSSLVILPFLLIQDILSPVNDVYFNRIVDLAVKNNDPSLCHKMVLWMSGEDLRPYCYIELATKTKDISLCHINPYSGTIEDDTLSFLTCAAIVAQDVNDLNFCDQFRDSEAKIKDKRWGDGYSTECYTKYGIENNNPEVCEHLYNNDDKNICYAHMDVYSSLRNLLKEKNNKIYTNKNYTDNIRCEKVIDTEKKKECYSWELPAHYLNE